VFGDNAAIRQLADLVRDKSAPIADRSQALQAILLHYRRPDLIGLLEDLIKGRELRAEAIRGLAVLDLPEIPNFVFSFYTKLSSDEKADAVLTLASRPAWALKLLDAVEARQIPRSDISVFVARQMQGLKDKQVGERLAKVWGQIKPASQEKAALTAK